KESNQRTARIPAGRSWLSHGRGKSKDPPRDRGIHLALFAVDPTASPLYRRLCAKLYSRDLSELVLLHTTANDLNVVGVKMDDNLCGGGYLLQGVVKDGYNSRRISLDLVTEQLFRRANGNAGQLRRLSLAKSGKSLSDLYDQIRQLTRL